MIVVPTGKEVPAGVTLNQLRPAKPEEEEEKSLDR